MADLRISDARHIEQITGNERIPASANGEAGYVEVRDIMIDPSNFLTSMQAAQKYYPKVEGEDLKKLVDLLDKGLGDKADRVVIEVVSGETFESIANGEPLKALVNRYYRFDSPVNTLVVTLPNIPEEENPRVKSLILSFTTGDAPQVSINADVEVDYFAGYSIEPNTTYELNLMFNGSKWIVAYGVVE